MKKKRGRFAPWRKEEENKMAPYCDCVYVHATLRCVSTRVYVGVFFLAGTASSGPKHILDSFE